MPMFLRHGSFDFVRSFNIHTQYSHSIFAINIHIVPLQHLRAGMSRQSSSKSFTDILEVAILKRQRPIAPYHMDVHMYIYMCVCNIYILSES